MRFVDTNVLLYAVSSLPEDASKRRRARELLRERDLAVSVQVFQEFYHQATRPTRPGRLSDGDAVAFLGTLLEFPVQDVTLALFRDAVAMSRRSSCPIGTELSLPRHAPAAATWCTRRT
ncbi:MAG: PIN domain-containing protein [Acidobacteria bacterium]|nr:PIN domain-containing protein [Acidobacteriota bacterium]